MGDELDLAAQLERELSEMGQQDLGEEGDELLSQSSDIDDGELYTYQPKSVVQGLDGTLQLSDAIDQALESKLQKLMAVSETTADFASSHEQYLAKFENMAHSLVIEPSHGQELTAAAASITSDDGPVVVSQGAAVLDKESLKIRNKLMLDSLDAGQRLQYMERSRIREEQEKEEAEREQRREQERLDRRKRRDEQMALEREEKETEREMMAALEAKRESELQELDVAKSRMQADLLAAEEARKAADKQFVLESNRLAMQAEDMRARRWRGAQAWRIAEQRRRVLEQKRQEEVRRMEAEERLSLALRDARLAEEQRLREAEQESLRLLEEARLRREHSRMQAEDRRSRRLQLRDQQRRKTAQELARAAEVRRQWEMVAMAEEDQRATAVRVEQQRLLCSFVEGRATMVAEDVRSAAFSRHLNRARVRLARDERRRRAVEEQRERDEWDAQERGQRRGSVSGCQTIERGDRPATGVRGGGSRASSRHSSRRNSVDTGKVAEVVVVDEVWTAHGLSAPGVEVHVSPATLAEGAGAGGGGGGRGDDSVAEGGEGDGGVTQGGTAARLLRALTRSDLLRMGCSGHVLAGPAKAFTLPLHALPDPDYLAQQQQEAALTLQCWARVLYAQRTHRRLARQRELENEQAVAAAVVIQAHVAAWLFRCHSTHYTRVQASLVALRARRAAAATTLQAWVRGRRVRRKLSAIKHAATFELSDESEFEGGVKCEM